MSAPEVDGPVRLDPSRPELSPDALADRTRGIGHGMCVYTGYARTEPARETPVPIEPVEHWPGPGPARADLPGWLVIVLVVAAVVALVAVAIGGVR